MILTINQIKNYIEIENKGVKEIAKMFHTTPYIIRQICDENHYVLNIGTCLYNYFQNHILTDNVAKELSEKYDIDRKCVLFAYINRSRKALLIRTNFRLHTSIFRCVQEGLYSTRKIGARVHTSKSNVSYILKMYDNLAYQH